MISGGDLGDVGDVGWTWPSRFCVPHFCLLHRHAGPVGSVRFNPHYLMAASCCYNLVFWAHPEPEQSPPAAVRSL